MTAKMKRIIYLGIAILLMGACFLVFLLRNKQEKHAAIFRQLAAAYESLSTARSNQLNHYAADEFLLAEALYNEALAKCKHQSDKWILRRDYSEVAQLLEKIQLIVSDAGVRAVDKIQRINEDYQKQNSEVGQMIHRYEAFYSHLPLPEEVRAGFVKGRLIYDEAGLAYSKGVLNTAQSLMNRSAALVGGAYYFGDEMLKDYFGAHEEWRRLNGEALRASFSQKVILIDKVARILYVYKNGKPVHEMASELGSNWVGDKYREGDMTTPEGKYLVSQKKEGNRTIYYKALLLNYPNEQDKQRFEDNKQKGLIPRNASIGSLIEIHGSGGRGVDWTKGCIALENHDMDTLFRLVEVNTPVYIVGSLKSLNELYNIGSIRPRR